MRIVIALLLAIIAVALAAPLKHADAPKAIEGSYIVVLKDNTRATARDAHILELQGKMAALADGSAVEHKYKIGSFIGFSAKLSKELLEQELAHPLVKYIEADQEVMITSETQDGATWGLDRIDQRNLPINDFYMYNNSAGAGVHVYVMDTGIYAEHTDFGGRASSVYNAITNESPTDLNGHGTHCAGTVGGALYGVAKKVTLYSVKVLSAGGSGSWAGVIGGIDYVTNNRAPGVPAVASMSLGGGISTAVDQAVANSIASGVVYSIAAGNSNGNACNSSPARVPTCISVGATDSFDSRSSFSNYGTCVDIFAPGSAITSDWIGSPNAITTISGTSMACPHVSGVVALHLASFPTLTPAQVLVWLTSAATPNVIRNVGLGSPNLLLFSPVV